jgi:hypothetical protein
VTVIVTGTGDPTGVTISGLMAQVAPAGSPEHEIEMAELNPFSGVTVRLTVPCCPELTVREVGETEREKAGGDKSIRYAAEATLLWE